MSAVTPDGQQSESARVKSSERTLRLLEIVSQAPTGGMAVTELHKVTGYPRSSLHQLIRTMGTGNWLEISSDGSRVSVGPRALVVGTSYLDHDAALPFATEALEGLRARIGYTVHYARLHGADVLYLATREATDSQRATSRVGRFLPSHATALGKALLAERTPAERAALFAGRPLAALTDRTITDQALLDVQLETIRAEGVAHEREENTVGVVCVAAVVRHRIPATDAISCSIPRERATDDELAHVTAELTAAASRLSSTFQAQGVR
ncbi:IclR family transcriptional regulator [Microbacterium sp. PRC9]|uniref:IclR family transcriptional regulator n=1 Tax=Microbacterium sp. PRC9 TaxID=2962591 RepID=UPI002882CB59|nr:IclR family transcriptional regulator [Microbacterium sp. PRC9]MDT0144832.1 IclR family transcriptional regulator [Microbacterium sp. PRC9]